MGLSKFELLLERLGVDRCGISFEWLEKTPNTSKLFDWMSENLTEANLVTPQISAKYNDIGDDEILNDEELYEEFRKISCNDVYDSGIDVEYDVGEAEKQLKVLNEKFDLAKIHLEALHENISRGMEMNSKLDVELEYYKNKRNQKLNKLCDITKECKDAANTLKYERLQVANLIQNESEKYILLGKYMENQLNEDDLDEYSLSINGLNTYFRDSLHNSLKNTLKNTNVSDDNVECESIDLPEINKCSKKMEIAMFNYMKTKGKLAESEKLLELYHHFNNTGLSICNENTSKQFKTDLTDKRLKRIISNFMENCIASYLYRELETKTLSIGYLHGELSTIHTYMSNLNECGKILLLSLKCQEKKKEELCSFFFQIVKMLIHDNMTIQSRKKIVEDLNNFRTVPFITENILNIKDEIYKMLSINENVPFMNVLQDLNREVNKIDDIKDSILNDGILKAFVEYKNMKNNTRNVKKFIWNGATVQPIMYNKRVELNIYECEQRNSSDSMKIKEAVNVYKQIMDNTLSDTIMTPFKNNASVSFF